MPAHQADCATVASDLLGSSSATTPRGRDSLRKSPAVIAGRILPRELHQWCCSHPAQSRCNCLAIALQ